MKNNLSRIILLLILTFQLKANTAESNQAADLNYIQNLKFSRHCQIVDINGVVIKNFPGDLCLFLKDGNLISAGIDGLKMTSPNKKVLWTLPGYFHHQLNLTEDEKYILAMGSQNHSTLQKTRIDRFLKIDMNGKIVAEQNAEKLFETVRFTFPIWKQVGAMNAFDYSQEKSHCNSFYEVPPNKNQKIGGPFQPGSIILNCLDAGIFILDQNMQKVLGHYQFKHSLRHSVHDVQMLPDGQLLYLNNLNADQKKGPHSSIEIWNLLKKK